MTFSLVPPPNLAATDPELLRLMIHEAASLEAARALLRRCRALARSSRKAHDRASSERYARLAALALRRRNELQLLADQ